MGLIDLQTDLKSLKYSTVPGNGTGPIVQKSIPLTQTSTIGYSADYAFKGQGFTDALADDVVRIGGWFDQNRGSWALKQATLEVFNPKTESDLITRVPDVLGINAIASTGGSPLGIYLAKNGIAGFIPEDSKYEANVRENNEDGKNRLVELTNRFIYQNTSQTFSFLGPLSGLANNISNTVGGFFNQDDPILFSYAGGPGGPITTIRKASNQKGTNEFSTTFDFKQPITEESLQSSFNPFTPKNSFLSPYMFPNFGKENNPISLNIIPEYTGSNSNANLDNTRQTDSYELGLDNVTNTYSGGNSYILSSLGLSDYTFENIQGSTLGSILAKYTGSNGPNDSKFSNPNANLNDFESTNDYSLGLDGVKNTYSEKDNSYILSLDFSTPEFKNKGTNLGSILAKYTGSNSNVNLDTTRQTDDYPLGLDKVTSSYSEGDSYISSSLGLSNYTFENIQGSTLGSILAKYTGSKNPNADLDNTIQTDDYPLGLDKVTSSYSEEDNSYISSLGFSTPEFENKGTNSGSILAKYTDKNPNANLDSPRQTDPYELGLDEVTNTYSEGDNSYLEGRETQLEDQPQRKNIFPSIFGIKTPNDNTPRNRINYITQPNSNSDTITTKGVFPINGNDIESETIKDLIKFRFAAIRNDKPSDLDFIQFRAYLTNFTDNFNPSWDSVKYVGRGEEFYNYTGFSRNVSFNLAFAALTRQELNPLYNKINYLASLTAPDYTDNGYIRGNIVKLTIGDYITNQPGVIDSLSYNIEDNVMWEINLEEDENIGQFPHVLKAQIGMKLIHKGLPQKGYSFIGSGDAVTSFDLLS